MYRFLTVAVIAAVLTVPAFAAPPASDNEALCQRFYNEVMDQGKLATIDELVAPNFVEHQPFPGIPTNRDGLTQFVTMMRTAFPDLKCTVNFMMQDGDKVAVYGTMSGTQNGEFMGVPASGKKFSVDCVDIVRIVNKQAVEHWGVMDSGVMMQQLGIPAPVPAPKGK
ncbi:MAG TPA: ester cyclase [Candidatus Krumholzibacteria bacterium]|nr:ester cyclase [Candidatus Krumholzibacteria bacterium]